MTYRFPSILPLLFALALVPQGAARAKAVPDRIETANSGVQYVTGGIGDDSRQEVNRLAREHHCNVKLVFARRSGNFVADIPVIVDDAQGNKVLALQKSDSILMLRLPPGWYTARAEHNGAEIKHSFEAPESGVKLIPFSWRKLDNPDAAAAHK